MGPTTNFLEIDMITHEDRRRDVPRKEAMLARRIRQRTRKPGFTPVERTSPRWAMIALKDASRTFGSRGKTSTQHIR